MDENKCMSIKDAQLIYIDRLRSVGKSKQTVKAYGQGIKHFMAILEENGVDITGSLDQLTIATYDWMIISMENKSASTRSLYITAVTGFFEYLTAMELIDINLIKMQVLKKSSIKPAPPRLPQFSKDNINKVLDYAQSLNARPAEDEEDRLRNYRDRALLLTLADTGLRIHEACNLERGSIDFEEGRAIIIGKGNKQAVIRFTTRSLQAIRDYLKLRSTLDGASGKRFGSLPLFMRHDRPIGRKNYSFQYIKLSTQTGRDIVDRRVLECLGPGEAGKITPHSFRHYFVTIVLNASGNMKIAQELARHSNISTTSKYAHLSNDELDKAYYDALESK